jgi:hypothetical protein
MSRDLKLWHLPDGSRVVIRPVRASDGPLLLDAFARLSPESRRLRVLIGKNALSAKEVRYFTDIDHHDHEALGAIDLHTGAVQYEISLREPRPCGCLAG